jgi:hypothetical protein
MKMFVLAHKNVFLEQRERINQESTLLGTLFLFKKCFFTFLELPSIPYILSSVK